MNIELEAICTGDATTIPLSEKLPVRCRVKIQVNEAMIQIIIGRYKKKSDKPVYCNILHRQTIKEN